MRSRVTKVISASVSTVPQPWMATTRSRCAQAWYCAIARGAW
jgi:hypothetical protein